MTSVTLPSRANPISVIVIGGRSALLCVVEETIFLVGDPAHLLDDFSRRRRIASDRSLRP